MPSNQIVPQNEEVNHGRKATPAGSPDKKLQRRMSKRTFNTRKTEKEKRLKEKIAGNWLTSLFETYETKQFRVGRMLVEDQTSDHQQLDTFRCVVGDLRKELDDIIDSVPKGKSRNDLLLQRDGAGACIIHIAYLYQRYDIGRSLIERFPELSVLRYSRVEAVGTENGFMPYLGENILHMAIAARNIDEVKWLIEFHKSCNRPDLLLQMLSARCFGHFFQPDFHRIGVYFGELPIHFAVCSNDLEMLDLLVDADPNSLFFLDSHGNNALHFCVIHSLERMFDYVIMHAENIIRRRLSAHGGAAVADRVSQILNEQLLHVFNNDALTPFTLAASEGKEEMFRHILRRRTKRLWSYGPVDCSVVDLTNLDTIQVEGDAYRKKTGLEFKSEFASIPAAADDNVIFEDYRYPALPEDEDWGDSFELNRRAARNKERFGAIECICKEDHLEMLEVPEVKEIIAKKWERFGSPTFLAASLFGILRTIIITLIICTFEYSEEGTGFDIFALALYPISILLMTANVVSDLHKIYIIGWKHFGYGGLIRGAAQLENVCSAGEFIFFGTACILKMVLFFQNPSYGDAPVRVFIAMAALTSWIRIYYILMGFEKTGNFVVIVSTIIIKDIPLFMWIYITILMGFGSCHAVLSIIQDDTRTIYGGFNHFFLSIWGIFRYTIDGQNFSIYDNAEVSIHNEWLFQILQACYNICIVLLMLNLLIAMLSETYSDLITKSHLILARERYNMMCAFEIGMDRAAILETMKKYAICEINQLPAFEMQTMNEAWSRGGSAATADFDDKMSVQHVDMLPEVQELASRGAKEALQDALKDRPDMLNSRDAFGGNLLHWACLCLSFDTVRMLVRKGIDLNVVCYDKRRTPLHDAVTAFCEADEQQECVDGEKIIKYLVEKGCKYQLRDSSHRTPLDIAKEQGKYDEVKGFITSAQKNMKVARADYSKICRERKYIKRPTTTST